MEISEKNPVWANTRRFLRPDFMFFRWIYNIISGHNLRNRWWERCEIENPLEELNPGDTYEYIVPFVAVANLTDYDETLELWNFAYNLYMIITPNTRIGPRHNQNFALTTAHHNCFLSTMPNAMIIQPQSTSSIGGESLQVQEQSPELQLPSAKEIGSNLGFVESDIED